MKEIIIKSEKFKEILAQMLDGKISMLEIKKDVNKTSDEDFFVDGERFIWEIYKVLREVDRLKGFDDLKEEDEELDGNDERQVLYV